MLSAQNQPHGNPAKDQNRNKKKIADFKMQLQAMSIKSHKSPMRKYNESFHEFSSKKAQMHGYELPKSYKKRLEWSLLN